jgi:hypothetical protein
MNTTTAVDPSAKSSRNLSEMKILDATLLDRGFYPEPQQLCH